MYVGRYKFQSIYFIKAAKSRKVNNVNKDAKGVDNKLRQARIQAVEYLNFIFHNVAIVIFTAISCFIKLVPI